MFSGVVRKKAKRVGVKRTTRLAKLAVDGVHFCREGKLLRPRQGSRDGCHGCDRRSVQQLGRVVLCQGVGVPVRGVTSVLSSPTISRRLIQRRLRRLLGGRRRVRNSVSLYQGLTTSRTCSNRGVSFCLGCMGRRRGGKHDFTRLRRLINSFSRCDRFCGIDNSPIFRFLFYGIGGRGLFK